MDDNTDGCQCQYHRLTAGEAIAGYGVDPIGEASHGRDAARLVLLAHARACLCGDWAQATRMGQALTMIGGLMAIDGQKRASAAQAPAITSTVARRGRAKRGPNNVTTLTPRASRRDA